MRGLAMAHWKRHPRRSANRTIVTVIASSLVAMVLLPSPAVAVGPLQDELSDQQALQLDAVELSRDRGISVEAAIQEMLLDRRAYSFAANVTEFAGDSMMGIWIDRDPSWVMRVAVADKVAFDAVDEMLAAGGLPYEVILRDGVSETRLREAADLMAGEAQESAGILGVEIDVRVGGIVVLAEPNADVSPLEKIAPEIAIDVVRVRSEVGDANRGGVAMSSCTAGFPVTKPSTSQVGLVTAGHCGNSQSGTPANAIVGHYICHRGKTTGYSCGYVVSTTFAPTWSNACNGAACSAVFTRVDSSTFANQPGDSGGPWFNGGVPVGIHKGGLYGDYAAWSVYTPISKLSTLSIGVL